MSVQTSKEGTPLAFTLQVRSRSLDMRIADHAKLTPKSAEANVEGFVDNDYATVMAKRVNHQWLAYRIDYDVQPIVASPAPTVTVTVTGTIVKVSPAAKWLTMLLDTGETRLVTVTKQTRWLLDGQPDVPPTLPVKGDIVRIVMRKTVHGWVALEINLKPATPRAFPVLD